MANDKSVAANLFPITAKQREALEFIYNWIASKGRTPTQSELTQLGGISVGIIHNLTAKGWIVQGVYGWWPVGVNRSIRFVFPATELIDNYLCDVHVREVKEASDRPACTMERLDDIIAVAGRFFKMSVADHDTLRWAHKELSFRDRIIKIQRMLLKPLTQALDGGAKGVDRDDNSSHGQHRNNSDSRAVNTGKVIRS